MKKMPPNMNYGRNAAAMWAAHGGFQPGMQGMPAYKGAGGYKVEGDVFIKEL